MLLTLLSFLGALAAPSQSQAPLPDSDDVKDVPAEAFLLDVDPMKRYALIGKTESAAPVRLCLVLPGGDGSIDFHPFVKRIMKYGLGPGWLEAQLVAPAWSKSPDRVVWPSASVPYQPAKFTTESFIDATIDDVKRRVKAPIKEVFLLGWSSSGPALYSYAVHGKNKVRGAFIAMSVFQPSFFKDATHLTVNRFYLLHSPQDFIPMADPNAAKAALSALHIPVQLDTYEGGHGWHGDVYGEIGAGFRFLMGSQ